jgi:hypothetical protein
MRKKLNLSAGVVFTFFLFISLASSEPAWWTQQKRDCGLSPSLAYNDWAAQGYPCNGNSNIANGGGNSNYTNPGPSAEQVQNAIAQNEATSQREKNAEDARQSEFNNDKNEALDDLKDPSADDNNSQDSSKPRSSEYSASPDIKSPPNHPKDNKNNEQEQATPEVQGWAQITLQNNTGYWMNLIVDHQFGCGPIMPSGFCTHQVRPGTHRLEAIPRDKSVHYLRMRNMKIKRGESPTWTIE